MLFSFFVQSLRVLNAGEVRKIDCQSWPVVLKASASPSNSEFVLFDARATLSASRLERGPNFEPDRACYLHGAVKMVTRIFVAELFPRVPRTHAKHRNTTCNVSLLHNVQVSINRALYNAGNGFLCRVPVFVFIPQICMRLVVSLGNTF